MSGVSSPCVRLCVIDAASGLCEGCGRTLAEIAQWASLSESQRLAIMARLARAGRPPLTPPAPRRSAPR